MAFTTELSSQTDGDSTSQVRATLTTREKGHVKIAQQIARSTPEERKKLLAAIVLLAQSAMNTPPPRSSDDNYILDRCGWILREAADDSATLAAFGSDLSRIGNPFVEVSVIEALSTCRDSKAVELMAQFGRARLKESKEWLPGLLPSASKDETSTSGEKAKALFAAIQGLAKSANSTGKAIARELRDEFLRLFDGSPYRERMLEVLKAEIDPLLQAPPNSGPSRSPAPAAWPVAQSKQISQAKPEQPLPAIAPAQKAESASTARLVIAVVAVLGLVGLLLWFLRKK